MVWLWRWLFGYLTIALCGENAEKVLNNAVKNGITIWNLKCKKGNIIGNISIKNFIKLRYAKRGIKCKIKILNKKGAVFKTKNYINRTGFFAGFVAFCVILFVLSNYVWIINVNGNEKISTAEILNSCKEIGIKEGISKNKINTKYDAQRLMLKQKGIAWSSFNIEGCVLTVNLTESATSDREERQIPSNLKAGHVGIIKKVNVTSGNTVIKVGDAVSNGDLLVSGVIENLSSTVFVHSSGEVIAETKREFSAEGKYMCQAKTSTNKVIKHYTIKFFNLKIPLFLGSVKKPYDYKINTRTLNLSGNKIPVKIACEQYEITKKETVKYTKSELEKMLYEDIQKQVKNFDFISCKEDNKEFIYTDKGILLKITYICEENIALQDKILLGA